MNFMRHKKTNRTSQNGLERLKGINVSGVAVSNVIWCSFGFESFFLSTRNSNVLKILIHVRKKFNFDIAFETEWQATTDRSIFV